MGTYVRDLKRAPLRRVPAGTQERDLWVAEAVARDLPRVSLEDALKLVHLYAVKESPKFERAAMKWLRRYLDESSPTLHNFAKVVRSLEQLELETGGRS